MSNTEQRPKIERRVVPVQLIETTPGAGAIGHWLLAAPMLAFLAWTWTDFFAHFSPLTAYWLDVALGLLLLAFTVVLPLGLAAHWLVTSLPRLFHHAGWDVQPLAPIDPSEQYLVRYSYASRQRAPTTWPRLWMRAGQGWVFLEIAAIFVGGVLMIPLFFSATEFGFGQ